MKVAELKRRLVPGVKLRCVHNYKGPCDLARTVAKVNTVDFMLTGDGIAEGRVSHMPWPKARDLRDVDGGFEIVDGDITIRYLWLSTPTGAAADAPGRDVSAGEVEAAVARHAGTPTFDLRNSLAGLEAARGRGVSQADTIDGMRMTPASREGEPCPS